MTQGYFGNFDMGLTLDMTQGYFGNLEVELTLGPEDIQNGP